MSRFLLLPLLILPLLACSTFNNFQTTFQGTPTPTKTPRQILVLENQPTATAEGQLLPLDTPISETSPTTTPILEVSTNDTSLPEASPTDTSTPEPLPSTNTPTLEPSTTDTATPEPLPTDTPSPQPPPATPIVGPASPKKGLGVIASPACADLETLDASWYLNWRPEPDATCGGVDERFFVPRIGNANSMQRLSSAIANAQASGWLIGFNEPNLSTHANMTPVEGAVLWKQIEDAAVPAGIKLVSPAPNQFAPGKVDPHGNQWLWAMVDEYQARYNKKPHFDAIGWNIYGCTNSSQCHSIDGMKNYLIQRRQEAQARGYNLPIWVLEYGGCQTKDSAASDQAMMHAITAWFNETDWIARYAWFSNRKTTAYQGDHDCILIDNDTLTELGQTYRQF